MQLADKVIVVTGAGSGIGRALAIALCRRGAIVAGVDYDAVALAESCALARSEQGAMSEHVLDISDPDQVYALPEQVQASHGRVDGLVNNAGIIHAHASIEELPAEQVERVFNVNWWGTYYMVMAFLPLLRARDEAGIVNVSSMGGYMPFPNQAAYGASKAAVKLLTEGLREELKRDTGISVSLVYPGAVKTGITENSPDISGEYKQAVRKLAAEQEFGVSAEYAAARIVRGLQRGSPRILVGTDSWLLDKLYRLMPVLTVSLMSRLVSRMVPEELVALRERRGATR